MFVGAPAFHLVPSPSKLKWMDSRSSLVELVFLYAKVVANGLIAGRSKRLGFPLRVPDMSHASTTRKGQHFTILMSGETYLERSEGECLAGLKGHK